MSDKRKMLIFPSFIYQTPETKVEGNSETEGGVEYGTDTAEYGWEMSAPSAEDYGMDAEEYGSEMD